MRYSEIWPDQEAHFGECFEPGGLHSGQYSVSTAKVWAVMRRQKLDSLVEKSCNHRTLTLSLSATGEVSMVSSIYVFQKRKSKFNSISETYLRTAGTKPSPCSLSLLRKVSSTSNSEKSSWSKGRGFQISTQP